jgi:hypothetical protein
MPDGVRPVPVFSRQKFADTCHCAMTLFDGPKGWASSAAGSAGNGFDHFLSQRFSATAVDEESKCK